MGSCIVLLKDVSISLYVRHNIRGKNLINITLACEIALDQVNFSFTCMCYTSPNVNTPSSVAVPFNDTLRQGPIFLPNVNSYPS